MSDEKQEDDAAIRMLNARRLVELRRRANSAASKEREIQKPRPPSSREKLLKVLVDRGDEVLYSAESRYPREMAVLVSRLADLVDEKKITSISGGELLRLLRSMGLRISVPTTISIEDHGKFVSLGDKLREKNDLQ